MKKFQFRLQAALDLRRQKEEMLQAELAAIQERLRQETEQLHAMQRQREGQMHSASTGRVGTVSIQDYRLREQYMERLEEEIGQQQTLLEMVTAEIEKKQAEVVIAGQETKALEKLRENHEKEHLRKEREEEQNFLDEIASIRASRIAANSN